MLIEIILLGILVLFVVRGWRRGLLASLLSLVVLVICFLGAQAAVQAFAPRTTEFLEPRLASALETRIESALESGASRIMSDSSGYLSGLLQQFGVNTDSLTAESSLETAAWRAAEEIAQFLAELLASALIFILVFLVIYLILHAVLRRLKIGRRMPVVRTLNRAGGAVFGLLKGILIVMAAAAILQRAGLISDGLGPVSSAFYALAGRIL